MFFMFNALFWRVCQKSQVVRPEGAEAPSPGQRPGCNASKAKRPVRAKALIMNAFALTGRFAFGCITPRALPWARSFCPFGACHLRLLTHLLILLYILGCCEFLILHVLRYYECLILHVLGYYECLILHILGYCECLILHEPGGVQP